MRHSAAKSSADQASAQTYQSKIIGKLTGNDDCPTSSGNSDRSVSIATHKEKSLNNLACQGGDNAAQDEYNESDDDVMSDEETLEYYRVKVNEDCSRRVYWGSGSPPAWRVRLCLQEKNIPYLGVMLSFEKRQHKSSRFVALNPRGMVPVFVDGEVVLYESLAILQYIEDVIDGPSLLPKSRRLRSRALMRMNEANNVSSSVGEVVYYLRRTAPDRINETYLNTKMDMLHKEFALWEGYLDANDYLAGDTVTLADVSFFPTLAYTLRLGFDISKYPRLNAYYYRMRQRQAVIESWPPHWHSCNGTQPLKGF